MASASSDLFDLLVCPESRGALIHFPAGAAGDSGPLAGELLLCPASRLCYRVDDGLPIMLVEEAERLPQAEVDRLVGVARQRGLRVPA